VSGLAWAFAALLLASAAAVAAWPAGAVLRRLNGRRPVSWRAVDLRRLWFELQAFAERSPRRAVVAAVLTGATIGLVVGGPVAALVLAVYGALGAQAVVRRAARRRLAAERSRSLDDLNALAADLRAGLAVGPAAWSPPGTLPAGAGREAAPDPRLAELTAAVWRLAEQTGAPAADLVERIEADARAGDRSRATAAAQAAGAKATALLLAALPIGGIALGYGIGVDPLAVLLTTPMGAACAVTAVLLQCAGLLWSERLANGPAR
jgi:tight adherence protein B